jgi:hypothetical protein
MEKMRMKLPAPTVDIADIRKKISQGRQKGKIR